MWSGAQETWASLFILSPASLLGDEDWLFGRPHYKEVILQILIF